MHGIGIFLNAVGRKPWVAVMYNRAFWFDIARSLTRRIFSGQMRDSQAQWILLINYGPKKRKIDFFFWHIIPAWMLSEHAPSAS